MIPLTVAQACEWVRSRMDELAQDSSDMLGDAVDDRNLALTVRHHLMEAIESVELAAPVSMIEADVYATQDDVDGLSVRDGVVEFGISITDFMRLVAFQAGDSDYVITLPIFEDTPKGRMQLNRFTRGVPDDPCLVALATSDRNCQRFRYYTTTLPVDAAELFSIAYLRHPVERYAPTGFTVSPSSLTFTCDGGDLVLGIETNLSWEMEAEEADYVTEDDSDNVEGLYYMIPYPLRTDILNRLTALVLRTYKDNLAEAFMPGTTEKEK